MRRRPLLSPVVPVGSMGWQQSSLSMRLASVGGYGLGLAPRRRLPRNLKKRQLKRPRPKRQQRTLHRPPRSSRHHPPRWSVRRLLSPRNRYRPKFSRTVNLSTQLLGKPKWPSRRLFLHPRRLRTIKPLRLLKKKPLPLPKLRVLYPLRQSKSSNRQNPLSLCRLLRRQRKRPKR